MPDPERKLLCPECDKEAAADAEACPGCGFPLAAWRMKKRMQAAEAKEADADRKRKEEDKKKASPKFLEHL